MSENEGVSAHFPPITDVDSRWFCTDRGLSEKRPSTKTRLADASGILRRRRRNLSAEPARSVADGDEF